MKTRLLPVLVAAALCLLAVLILTQRHTERPAYQGKPLEAWVLQVSSPVPEVREQAALALRAMGTNAIPGLMKLAQVKDSLLSEQLWPFARKFSTQHRSLLRRFIRPPSAMSMRGAAATSLGLLGSNASPAIQVLAQALHDPVDEVRWDAARALGKIGEEAVPVLTDSLRDKDYRVRHMAVSALGEMGCLAEPAVPALIQALGDPVPSIRASTIGSLVNIGQPAMEPLIAIVNNGAGLPRQGAAQALIRLSLLPRVVGPPLLNMVRDENADSRLMAINFLGDIHAGDARVVTALAGALKDSSPAVRLSAAKALGQLGSKAEASVPALAQALTDETPSVREQAAVTLGAIGTAAESATPKLVRATSDSQNSVRTAAKTALEKIGAPDGRRRGGAPDMP